MLLCKLLDFDGSSPSYEAAGDEPPFSYFAAPIPTSSSYEITTLYDEVSRRWADGAQAGEVPVFPQKTYTTLATPAQIGTWLDGTRSAGRASSYVLVDGPDDGGYYRYTNNLDQAVFRRPTGTANHGGFRWLRVDDIPTVFNSGVPYESFLYNVMHAMQAPFSLDEIDLFDGDGDDLTGSPHIGWTATPVVALATADVADAYEIFDFRYQNRSLTMKRVRTLEVIWHSRLDATAESLAADCVAGKAAARPAIQTFEAYVRTYGHRHNDPTYEALKAAAEAAHVAYDNFFGGGGQPAPTYRHRVITAARDWIDANL